MSCKRKHDYRKMSGKHCRHEGCEKLIKLNVVERLGSKAKYCYKHWLEHYEKGK